MADPNDTTIDPSAQQVEPAPPPAANVTPPALTLESVQAMIAAEAKKAYDAGAAAARRSVAGKQPKKPDTQPQDQPSGDVAASDDPEFAESLTDAIGEFSFDREQRREIRAAARREKPEDVDAFVAKWGRMFGKSPGSTPAPAPNPAAAGTNPSAQKPAPSPPPPLPAPAPPPADPGNGSVFRALSDEAAQDAWQAYIRRKGADPGNPYSPKNRAVWREMRNAFEREASISSIRLGARRS